MSVQIIAILGLVVNSGWFRFDGITCALTQAAHSCNSYILSHACSQWTGVWFFQFTLHISCSILLSSSTFFAVHMWFLVSSWRKCTIVLFSKLFGNCFGYIEIKLSSTITCPVFIPLETNSVIYVSQVDRLAEQDHKHHSQGSDPLWISFEGKETNYLLAHHFQWFTWTGVISFTHGLRMRLTLPQLQTMAHN